MYFCGQDYSPVISVTLSIYLQWSGSSLFATYTNDQTLIQEGWIVSDAYDTYGNALTIVPGTTVSSIWLNVNGSVFGISNALTGASFSDGVQNPPATVILQSPTQANNIWKKFHLSQDDGPSLLISGTSTIIDSFDASIRSVKYLISCENTGGSPSIVMTCESTLANPSDPLMNPIMSVYGIVSTTGLQFVTFDVRRKLGDDTIVEVIATTSENGVYATLVKQYI